MATENGKTKKENEERVAEEYLSSLADLNCNSKPLINMLTILAEENMDYAPVIVRVVEHHIHKVPPEMKLPILYLIDSIVKNVPGPYVQLFSQCIVNIFCGVFEKVNEKIRERMYALRQTWNEVFSVQKLYTLDVKVKNIDNNWPITAKIPQPSIHVNPNFLNKGVPSEMEEILHAKTRELLELKKRKLELELEATKKHLEEQEKQLAIGATPNVETPKVVQNTQPNAFPPNLRNMPQQNQFPLPVDNKLNTVRHRDPRLMKQQLQQQQKQQQQQQQIQQNANSQLRNNAERRRSPSRATTTTIDDDEHSRRRKGRSTSNSPAHSSGYSARSSSSSSSRFRSKGSSEKSSSKSSSDKRSSSSSSSSKKSSSERHAKSKAGDSSPSSNSSGISPTKHKDSSKRKSKSSSKTRSRSNSPREERKQNDVEKRHSTTTTTSTTTDVVKEQGNTTTMSTHTKTLVIDLIDDCETDGDNPKPIKKSNTKKSARPSRWSDADKKTVDLSQQLLVENHTIYNNIQQQQQLQQQQQQQTITMSTTSNNNKVSFKLNKTTYNNKIIEKNKTIFENSPTAIEHGTLSSSLAVPALLQQQQQQQPVSGAFSKSIKDAISSLAQSDNEVEMNNLSTDEGKRKSSNNVTDDEPLIKRSKALNGNNNDKQNLFGESDMEIDEECAPSPPVISKDTDEWSKKRSPSSPKNANLDSVRAKLLKATKYSKVGKFEKNNRDLSHRLKLADLHTNEDSQEANDEKIRTILTQAQEMLDTKSINSEQYRTLLQTVMSINESNKLKEAKKRESLLQTNAEDEFEKERTAAREAVLKKRIPKLTKANNKTTSPLTTIVVDSPSNSPLYEDNNNAEGNDENDHRTQRQRVSRDNKRTKPSKWGERVEVPNHMQQRNWLNHNNNNNIVRPGFRPNMPANALANNNLLLPQFAGFNNNHGLMRGNSSVPPPPQPPMALRLPIAATAASSALPNNTIAKPCNSIDNPQVDLVRTITVDGQSKEIRIYGAVAIVFMELDQPREIGFKPGQRAIVIDNGEPVVLQFNDVYKPVNVAGVIHQMRFGFPSRELYIDENWYEIYFGGMPVSIPIAGKRHILKAEGPPPQVHIGPLRRDLVVGKINMIVDAHIVIPLFLDAHLQTFQLGEQQHTIQFADNLLSVLLDGELAKVEYGGLPKSYKLGDGKYFIRFTALPQGVVAGKVQIKDMIYVDTEPATESATAATAATPAALESMKMEVATSDTAAAVAPPTVSALNNLNIDELFQKLVSSGILGATTSIPVGEAKVEKENAPDKAEAQPETGKSEVEDMSEHFAITPINLRVPESIKTRQQGIVNMLFHGMQCSSCGVRFPPEQTIKYSQHLDWHFRQNRRERDAARKAHARKWFYNLADWLQYKEIEDIEEREKNYFESQQHEDADEDDTISNQRANSPEPTCAAGPDDVDRACDMCHEKFEQFYNEELEEWHLRCAIRIEDKLYHPLCYEDYKASLVQMKTKKDEEDTTLANANDDNAMDIDMKTELKPKIEIPMETAVIDDDDDDVIVLPNEEPVITELDDDDDDEYVPSNVTREQMGDITLDEAVKANNVSAESTTESDADIEIQEPNIPFTDLDTYVEKELTNDEVAKQAFMNVKIKEEPKDDDEDDGFEEVGTVLISADEEITINSEDTIHSPMINTKDSEAPDTPEVIEESSTIEGTLEEGNNSNSVDIDGNQANEDKLNLSSTGGVNPAPVIPLASLVNKIKINITKNINTTNSTNSNITTTTTSTTSTTTTGESISSIPVLYGGAAVTTSQSMNFVGDLDAAHGNDGNIVNNIRVIGAAAPSAPTSVLPIEDTITYELKPLLKNVPLKKVKKIEAGVETSGLCSIM